MRGSTRALDRPRLGEYFPARNLLALANSAFLRGLGPEVSRRVADLAGQVSATLDDWSRKYPFIRRERIPPLALSVAAAAPFAGAAALSSAARVSLWVFGLDDAIDEEHLAADALSERVRQCSRILRGVLLDPATEPFAGALAEVRRDLSRYPLFTSLGGVWDRALARTIESMLREEEWRRAHRAGSLDLPSYQSYVANGRYSIGGPPHVWATIITIDDPSAPRHLARLRAMERLASICVRLSNDLRSAAKELREGKLNALSLGAILYEREGMDAGAARMAAEQRVRQEIVARVRRLLDLRERSVTTTGRPEAATADIAAFVTDFYETHDYHTFLPESAHLSLSGEGRGL